MPKRKSKKAAELRGRIAADLLIGAALFIVTGIMPLIVHAALRPIPPDLHEMINELEKYDIFAYWRSWFVILPAVVIIFYFASELLTGNFKGFDIKSFIKTPPVAAAAVYLLFALISSVFSPYRYTAFIGTVDRFEGFFALASYLVIFITAMYGIRDKNLVKPVLSGLVFSSLIMGLIGLSQFLHNDFYMSWLGSYLVAGKVSGTAPKLTSAYGALFNPNTYGLYGAAMSPLLLICGFTYDGRRALFIPNILAAAAGALMLIGIPASRSLGGMIGAAAGFAALIITYAANRVYQRKLPHIAAALIIAAVVSGGVFAYMRYEPLRENIARTYDKFKLNFDALRNGEKPAPRTGYIFDGGTLSATDYETVFCTLRAGPDDWLEVYDPHGEPVPPSRASESADGTQTFYRYDVPDYRRINITRNPDHFVFDRMYLAIIDGEFMPFRPTGLPIDIKKPIPKFGFEGYEALASGRFYIWSRSLPLILKHVIIGSGPDTYINEFPQDDIVGKYRFLYDPYIIVDKAHNLYLQALITTGGISVLALIFLMGYYIFTTFISLIKTRGRPAWYTGLRFGLFTSVTAYAVASLATDSTIATAGVFWVVLGLGYAMNRLETEK